MKNAPQIKRMLVGDAVPLDCPWVQLVSESMDGLRDGRFDAIDAAILDKCVMLPDDDDARIEAYLAYGRNIILTFER